jgi:hypothetical protein
MMFARVIEPECANPSWLLSVALSFEVKLSEPLDIDHDGNQTTWVASNPRGDGAQPRGREHCEMTILV